MACSTASNNGGQHGHQFIKLAGLTGQLFTGRGGLVRAWCGARRLRDRDQSRARAAADCQDRIGRRARAPDAGAQGGLGAGRLDPLPGVRRGRYRDRRRDGRCGRRAIGAARTIGTGLGRHPCAAGRGPCRPSLARREILWPGSCHGRGDAALAIEPARRDCQDDRRNGGSPVYTLGPGEGQRCGSTGVNQRPGCEECRSISIRT